MHKIFYAKDKNIVNMNQDLRTLHLGIHFIFKEDLSMMEDIQT